MTPGDAEAVARIYEPHVTIGPASFEFTPPDAAEMRARHAAITAMYPWLVCERGGEVAGYAYASAHNPRDAYIWSVNVTVYIAQEHHRQGVGRALYTALFALLRLQGFCTAIGGITLPNAGSVGLHEAMGFRLVGIYRNIGFKSGAWRDVGWWQLALQEPPPEPVRPRPFPEIVDMPAAGQAINPVLVLP
jgi:phosphinothricin acetyltransferase